MNRSALLWTQRTIRLIVAAVFIVAGVAKMMDPKAFARDVDNFMVLPDWAINPVALVLPWIEVVTGLLLLPGVWVFETVLIFLAMSLAFEFGAIRALVYGIDIQCGCFGKADRSSAGVVVAKNAVLIAMYLVIWYTAARLQRIDGGVAADQRPVGTPEPVTSPPPGSTGNQKTS